MHISRRGLLGAAATLPLALAGCSLAAAITLTEQVISDIQNVEAALGNVVPANLVAQINGYLADVDKFLAGLAPGSILPPTTAANIFSDLQQALSAVSGVLAGNPIVMAAQVVLAAIAGAWGLIAPNLAAAGAPPLDTARGVLARLPRHQSAA